MGKNKGKRSHTKHVFVQKKYRDALFRRIFNALPLAIAFGIASGVTPAKDLPAGSANPCRHLEQEGTGR